MKDTSPLTRPRDEALRVFTVFLLIVLVTLPAIVYVLSISQRGAPNVDSISTTASSASHSIETTTSIWSPSPLCTITGGNLSKSCIGQLERQRIAVIKSVFTTTPYAHYADSSFYAFYHWADKNAASCTSQNVEWLNSTVVNAWGRYGGGLERFVQSAIKNGYFDSSSTKILTDIQVNDGALFTTSGDRKFDVVMLGFAEYVTAAEYSQFKHFVATGGRLIMVTSNSFVAEVAYSHRTNTERLVLGHGWSFDGKTACRGVFQRWYDDNTNWMGSNLCCFYTAGYALHGAIANTSDPESVTMRRAFGKVILQSYRPHEESAITNYTGSRIIAYWNVSYATMGNIGQGPIVIYSHLYGEGKVINTGIFGTDIIGSDQQLQFFVHSSILQ